LWGWGGNEIGQLGDGTNIAKSTPIQIGSDNDWVSVAAGNHSGVALKEDGSLWGWGWGGMLGDGNGGNKNSPVKVGNDNTWASVTAGNLFNAAIKIDGSLWTWGLNGSGQLGNGTFEPRWSPDLIGVDRTWRAVSTGSWQHTAALKHDGTLWAWGSNYSGELGDGEAWVSSPQFIIQAAGIEAAAAEESTDGGGGSLSIFGLIIIMLGGWLFPSRRVEAYV